MSKNVMIDGVEYAPVERGGERMRIVVTDNRGLTFVGRCDLSGNDEQIVIRGARCVIRWGTTRHIAELAEGGPTDKTKLGQACDVTVFRGHIVASYSCGEVWS